MGRAFCPPISLHGLPPLQGTRRPGSRTTSEQEPIRTERQELRGYTREVEVYRKVSPVCGREFGGGPRAKYNRQAFAVAACQQRHPDRATEQRRSRERRKRREKGEGTEADG